MTTRGVTRYLTGIIILVMLCVITASASPDSYARAGEGVSLIEAGDYEEALVVLTQATTLDPGDFYAWYNRGVACLYLGKNQEALQSFNAALEIDPKYGDALVNRAAALIELARAGTYQDPDPAYRKAIQAASTAIDLDIKNKRAWYQRGLAYWELGNLDVAFGDFAYALQIDPEYTVAKEAMNKVSNEIRDTGYTPPDDNGFPGGKAG